jgi:hypothetical protein
MGEPRFPPAHRRCPTGPGMADFQAVTARQRQRCQAGIPRKTAVLLPRCNRTFIPELNRGKKESLVSSRQARRLFVRPLMFGSPDVNDRHGQKGRNASAGNSDRAPGSLALALSNWVLKPAGSRSRRQTWIRELVTGARRCARYGFWECRNTPGRSQQQNLSQM